MPTLTRRRSDNQHHVTWHVFYHDIRVGTIGERAGFSPNSGDPDKKAGIAAATKPIVLTIRKKKRPRHSTGRIGAILGTRRAGAAPATFGCSRAHPALSRCSEMLTVAYSVIWRDAAQKRPRHGGRVGAFSWGIVTNAGG
jgi:hypothetical protein